MTTPVPPSHDLLVLQALAEARNDFRESRRELQEAIARLSDGKASKATVQAIQNELKDFKATISELDARMLEADKVERVRKFRERMINATIALLAACVFGWAANGFPIPSWLA